VRDVAYLLHQARVPHRNGTYIGWTYRPPWFRLSQHNGNAPGGVARLARMRPWAVALFVDGFLDARHARQFETAWQLGFRSTHLQYVTRFVRSRGAVGRAEELLVLLRSHSWRDHWLVVHVVRPAVGASHGKLARFANLVAALGSYPYVVHVDAQDP
jgi:hypothetical protein